MFHIEGKTRLMMLTGRRGRNGAREAEEDIVHGREEPYCKVLVLMIQTDEPLLGFMGFSQTCMTEDVKDKTASQQGRHIGVK